MQRVEILTASLKPGYRDEDLEAIIRWNTEYHQKRGVTDVRYFVSNDRKSFVMTISCEDALGEKLAKEWADSKVEEQEWWRSMMAKAVESGKSSIYREVTPFS
jgi:hypothetical protein